MGGPFPGDGDPIQVESLGIPMRDALVHWRRKDRTFVVVRPDGAAIADGLEDIERAWALADQAQREADDFRAWLHWQQRCGLRRPAEAH